MVLLGFGIIYYGDHLVKQSVASSLWPTTIGKVVVSRVERSVWDKSSPSIGSRRSTEKEERFSADVQYEYLALGGRYTGSNIHFIMPLHETPQEVRPLLDRYPVGSRAKVYFNPNDPGESVLETVVDEDTYTIYYAGIMWSVVWGLVLCVVTIVVYFKEARRKKA